MAKVSSRRRKRWNVNKGLVCQSANSSAISGDRRRVGVESAESWVSVESGRYARAMPVRV